MIIKITYQCVEVGEIVFDALTTIYLMDKIGYGSFNVRSKVAKDEYFASFKNEDTDEYITFYPDRSFIKSIEGKVTYEELDMIKHILDSNCTFNYYSKEEESE